MARYVLGALINTGINESIPKSSRHDAKLGGRDDGEVVPDGWRDQVEG